MKKVVSNTSPIRYLICVGEQRTESVLLELLIQALKADPEHPSWTRIRRAFRHAGPLKEPLLHWTRIAQPVMKHGRVNAERWELVS